MLKRLIRKILGNSFFAAPEFDIAKVEIGKNDVVILRTKERLTGEQMETLRHRAKKVFRCDVVVIEKGIDLAIAKRTE